MTTGTTYRAIVREVALDHYGYVTTAHAKAAGVPAGELPKLAARGGLEHVAYGLYRVTDFPPHELDAYAEALLRVGRDAFLYGESVLAVFGLADVNPRTITVGVRRRARPTLPTYIDVVVVKGEVATTVYEGLASQSVADALLTCVSRIERARLADAARQARAVGLLTSAEWTRVRAALRS